MSDRGPAHCFAYSTCSTQVRTLIALPRRTEEDSKTGQVWDEEGHVFSCARKLLEEHVETLFLSLFRKCHSSILPTYASPSLIVEITGSFASHVQPNVNLTSGVDIGNLEIAPSGRIDSGRSFRKFPNLDLLFPYNMPNGAEP